MLGVVRRTRQRRALEWNLASTYRFVRLHQLEAQEATSRLLDRIVEVFESMRDVSFHPSGFVLLGLCCLELSSFSSARFSAKLRPTPPSSFACCSCLRFGTEPCWWNLTMFIRPLRRSRLLSGPSLRISRTSTSPTCRTLGRHRNEWTRLRLSD